MKLVVAPVREDFVKLFSKTFDRSKNAKFLDHVAVNISFFNGMTISPVVCYLDVLWSCKVGCTDHSDVPLHVSCPEKISY